MPRMIPLLLLALLFQWQGRSNATDALAGAILWQDTQVCLYAHVPEWLDILMDALGTPEPLALPRGRAAVAQFGQALRVNPGAPCAAMVQVARAVRNPSFHYGACTDAITAPAPPALVTCLRVAHRVALTAGGWTEEMEANMPM